MNEVHTYKLFCTSNCTTIPLFLGSTQPVTVEYPDNMNMPTSSRLCCEQHAILLEYLDREMLLPDNATDESLVKVIQYLKRIYELLLLHGDVHQFMVSTLCNMIVKTLNGLILSACR